MSKLVEGIHYIVNEDDRVVFTALYLIEREKFGLGKIKFIN